jgi:hypothetical protein
METMSYNHDLYMNELVDNHQVELVVSELVLTVLQRDQQEENIKESDEKQLLFEMEVSIHTVYVLYVYCNV